MLFKKRSALIAVLLVSAFLFTVAIPAILTSSDYPTGPITTFPSNQQHVVSVKSPGSTIVPWWNTSFHYRIRINFTDTAGKDHVDEPVDVFLTFAPNRCHKNSIRVQYWNGENWLSQSLPYQIWNETYYDSNFYQSFTITFYVNVSASSTASYYVYYNDTDTGTITFTPQVEHQYSYPNHIFTGQNYRAYTRIDRYGGKIYMCYNNITNTYWDSNQGPFHWNPDYKIGTWYSTSSYAPVITPVVSEQEGPLFIKYTTLAKLRPDQEDALCNITYRFFKWGWICTTNTTFNYTQSSLWYCRNNEWVFDPQIMSQLTFKREDGNIEYITMELGQSYDLRQAEWLCFWEDVYGGAMGTFDITPLELNFSQCSGWIYMAHYVKDYQYWDRRMQDVSFVPGNYMFENFGIYIWDGRNGVSQFQTFAEGMKNPPTKSVGVEEPYFYQVNVHVHDYDGYPVSGAVLKVYNHPSHILNTTETTDENGNCVLYLRPDTYNITTQWNESYGGHVYQTYTNITAPYTVSEDTTLNINMSITTLVCHITDSSGNNVQNANVSLWNSSTSPRYIYDSKIVNLTAWAEFHISPGTYNITVWAEGAYQPINLTGDYTVSSYNVTTIMCTALHEHITKIWCENGTTLNPTWGDSLTLKVRWQNSSNDANLNSSALSNGVVEYKLSNESGDVITWTSITPSGSGDDIYYLVQLPSSLLFGGETYTVHWRADADSYLSAANQTVISVANVDPTVTYGGVSGEYYWNKTDIVLWVHIFDPHNNISVTEATVTFSSTGGEVSGNLNHISNGNYTYTITRAYIEAHMSAGYYTLNFTVSCTNYTTENSFKVLHISPVPTTLNYSYQYTVIYADNLTLTANYIDQLDSSKITNAILSYSIQGTEVDGFLKDPNSTGDYTTTFNSSLVSAGAYLITVTSSKQNFETKSATILLVVNTVPTELVGNDSLSVHWKDNLTVSVLLNDTHNGVPVSDASVSYTLKNSTGHVIYQGSLTPEGKGKYTLTLSTDSQNTTPGEYTLVISAEKGNYSTSSKTVHVTILGIATLPSYSNYYVSDPNSPALISSGPFIQVENNIPFVVVLFTYTDTEGKPVPNASVTINGIIPSIPLGKGIYDTLATTNSIVPAINLGSGVYAFVIPTNLPPSVIPFQIIASSENYETVTTFNLLIIKEWAIPIPFTSIRIPFSILLIATACIAIPTLGFTAYTSIKRARIPKIIRRIDELIKSISRGERVEVRPISRDQAISAILSDELAIVGVEPKVVRYIPVELADRIVPLLVESGMKEDEAYALAVELKTAAPAERERLLESVGIPGEISARVLQIIEEEEEKSELFRRPEPEEPEPETGEKEPEEPESEEPAGGEDEDREAEA